MQVISQPLRLIELTTTTVATKRKVAGNEWEPLLEKYIIKLWLTWVSFTIAVCALYGVQLELNTLWWTSEEAIRRANFAEFQYFFIHHHSHLPRSRISFLCATIESLSSHSENVYRNMWTISGIGSLKSWSTSLFLAPWYKNSAHPIYAKYLRVTLSIVTYTAQPETTRRQPSTTNCRQAGIPV